MTFSDRRYASMAYRPCGTSGLKLPAISLGAWHNFGNEADREEMRHMLFRAFDLGITHFDLANNYGPAPGSAERNVGRIVAEQFAGHRDELIISSKAGFRMWPGPYGDGGSRKYLIASCDASLERLGLDYVDIFYHHRFDPNTPIAESITALDQIVRSGKAVYAGISNYHGAATVEAAHLARELKLPLVIHQAKYSMLNRDAVEHDVSPQTRRLGLGIIAFCPLAQGLLTEKYLGGIPTDSRAARPKTALGKQAVSEEVVGKIGKLNEIAGARGQSMAQLALTWVLRDPAVTSALIGASRVSQIEENAGVAEAAPLTDEELAAVDEALSGS